jgi:hypothetical protein
MPRITPFSVGRRWKFKEADRYHAFGPPARFFVVVGPGERPNTKLCRIEVEGHGGPCEMRHCLHGVEQDYSHKHLKRYATLVE